MRAGLLCGIISCLSICVLGQPYESLKGAVLFEAVEEWHLWKAAHDKSYDSTLEELDKHIVWRSNKAYVDQHNINAKTGFFSYEVQLNHLADLVRVTTVSYLACT